MSKKFEMSLMGDLTFFLGLQIREKEGTFINQGKYERDLLKKHNFDQINPSKTPMSYSCSLDQDLDNKSIDQKLYRGLIDSLLYLIASRPDIMFSVGVYARFQANPKRISPHNGEENLRYLNRTRDLALWYSYNSDILSVKYSNYDYKVDRKNTTRNCQFPRSSLISCQSKKQHFMALSLGEVEYIVVGACYAQIL